MREAELPVKIEPQGKTVHALPGTKLLEAAARMGLAFNAPCGGQGTCGKCRVRVMPGSTVSETTAAEKEALSTSDQADGFRLACQTQVLGPVTMEVPATSLLGSTYQILGAGTEAVEEIAPAVRKIFLELSPPSRDDHAADVERLQHALPPFRVGLELLQSLSSDLREWGFRGTAVLADHTLIDFEREDTSAACYGLAFDIGTTTLVGVLVDLHTGRERASASRMNPQTRYGDDVLSRIMHARDHVAGLDDLRRAVVGAINEMIDELVQAAGVSRLNVYEMALAGNTTMQHLLLGLNPAALGEVPFVSATNRGLVVGAGETGFGIHPKGRVYVFPVIGGFVGGDTVAGVLTTALAESEGPTLFVDIGTNGEIVVVHDGRMVSASTAAGPAFEGARIHHGMRAATGAIEKVVLDDDVRMNVIGNVAPVGICGSALIDIAAELLRKGILLSQGMLLSAEQVPESLPDALKRRLVPGAFGTDFVLATAGESGTGEAVVLTQQDIRELQLATAAIRAGTRILLKRLDLVPASLERVLVAGAFGNFIRRSNAQCIGLLPETVSHNQIAYVGNTSLAGARLAVLSRKARHRAEAQAQGIEHVDLSRDPEFQNAYVECMFFPETCPPCEGPR